MKQSSLREAFSAFVNHPKQIGLIVLFYTLFFVVLVMFNKLIASFFSNDQWQFQALLKSLQPYFIFVLLGMVAYVLFSIFIYSFFKYCIMDSVRGCCWKKGAAEERFSFDRLGSFFGLNILVVLVFGVLAAFFSFLFIMSVRIEFILIVRNILLSVIAVLMYSFNSVSNSFFFQHCNVRETMVRTYRLCMEKPGRLLPLLVTSTFFAAALWIAYLGIDWLLIRAFGQASGSLDAFTVYQIVTAIVAFALVLLLLAFNQIYFFSIVRNLREERVNG